MKDKKTSFTLTPEVQEYELEFKEAIGRLLNDPTFCQLVDSLDLVSVTSIHSFRGEWP
jgi:hypothetical protein